MFGETHTQLALVGPWLIATRDVTGLVLEGGGTVTREEGPRGLQVASGRPCHTRIGILVPALGPEATSMEIRDRVQFQDIVLPDERL